MLNAGYKKEALKKCEEAANVYKKEYDSTVAGSNLLYHKKEEAIDILKIVDEYVHSLSNKPKEIEKIATEICIRRRAVENEIENLKIECKKADNVGKGVAGAGVLAGAGVAAFGPTAAMGIATTFGTASTGTAIATLSGIVQTNAALAWLGGGALAAGGGGMSAGTAFLAMAGPVGWAIGGTALLGGGLMANSKNKKVAEKAEQQAKEIKDETYKVQGIKIMVEAEIKAITPLNSGVSSDVKRLKRIGKKDYSCFTEEEKNYLWKLMNSANALSECIGKKVS